MNLTAPTVLYVEDTPVNVLVMEALFNFLPDARLTVARCGDEAWAVASTLDPALLLLDIDLPDCRGDDLLRRLRVLPGCLSVRAVAVTAEHRFDARAHGFDECWAKPLNLGDVLQRLQALLGAALAPAQAFPERDEPSRDVLVERYTDFPEAGRTSRTPWTGAAVG